MRNILSAAIVLVILVSGGSSLRAAPPLVCRSPDGAIAIEFALHRDGDKADVPHYRVRLGSVEVVAWSRLGVDLAGGESLCGPCEITEIGTRSIRDEYTQVPGKRRHVVGHAAEAIVHLRQTNKPHRRWDVVLRAYNDGIAFRYRFPAQEGWNELVIAGERTQFALAPDTRAYALPLNGFTTPYEKRYEVKSVEDLPKNWLLGLPLLLECRDGIWAGITEANIHEYAGMYLSPSGKGTLSARLSPLPREKGEAVRWHVPHASPWRVVLLGNPVGRLIESDLVLNLSDPCAIKDTSWIQSGKTMFPWWNDFYEEKLPFRPGLNTETAKYYIDFAAEAGIPFHSLDGVGDRSWYGSHLNPDKDGDPTKAVAGLNLPEVLKHAKAKGIRLRLWMNWAAAARHMERAFPLYRQWGIHGVMLDFMDRDDQEMNRFLLKAIRLAAENRLTVTLHGCPKPTGLERTYPNLLTHEGVLNLEYDKWDKLGVPPEHEVTVPFTRMLAGPLDFHQGSFRTVKPAVFKPRFTAPLVMGSPARTLASYVVYQNHLSMVADYPSAYRGHPGLPVLAAIPTTWDDTRVLAGKVGQFVAIARRSGDVWHIGVMNDRKARTLKLPLRFLEAGRYTAEMWLDDASAKHGLSRRQAALMAGDELSIDLDGAGGAYVKISPAK